MNSIKKIALTLSVLLALLAGDALAQCGGKTVYIELPETWGSTTYITWSGSFISVPGVKEGVWTKFTLPSTLSNDNQPDKAEIIFIDYNDYYNNSGVTHYVTRDEIGESKQTPNEGKFKCSDFSAVTYIYEDPSKKGKTYFTSDPPNAYYFYFLPPKNDDWALGIPYLAWREGGTIKTEKLAVDTRCGWYKIVYFDKTPPDADAWIFLNAQKSDGPDDKIGVQGMDEDPVDWVNDNPEPFNLARIFGTEPGTQFFDAQTGRSGWTSFDPGRKGTCEYKFAALIYHTNTSKNKSFSMYAGAPGREDGVTKGIAKETLDAEGKIQFNAAQGTDWTADNFRKAFTKTDGTNVQRCFDMPFTRRGDLWEFDALYLCPDGSADYTGKCGPIGGFYPPNLMRDTDEYGSYASQYTAIGGREIYKGDKAVVPKRCVNMWCFDRGWYGGNCSEGGRTIPAANRQDPTKTGDLSWVTSTSTKAQIDEEMKKTCWEPIRTAPPGQGDLYDYDSTIPLDGSSGKTTMDVSGLICFESAPATFTYQPGQEFFFRGDDDIWVFINNQLVVDLGGNHGPAPGYVRLDTISKPSKLVANNEYPINIFFCDRRGPGSNVRISTNMYFAQKSGIYVKEGDGKKETAHICIQQDGGTGSCAGLASGNTGPSELCGDDVKGKLEFYLTNRSGTIINELDPTKNPDNCRATSTAGEYMCYGGIRVNVNNGTAKVDEGVGLSGTWYLYVRAVGINVEDEKIATITTKSNVRMAWGNIIEGETGKLLTSICKQQNLSAATGELVPVCVSAGAMSGNEFSAGFVDDIAGSSFKLNQAGFVNNLGLKLKVFYDSLGTSPVDLSGNLALPGGNGGAPKPNSGSVPGVLVLWVTGDYNQNDNPENYTINVSGGADGDKVTLASYVPKLEWVKADFTTAIPAANQKGSQWITAGDPTSGVLMEDGKPKPVWVGETIKLYLRALTYSGKTCTTCTFDLEYEASANGITEVNSRLIGASGLRISNGVATLEIAGKKDVQDPKFAKITVGSVTSTVTSTRATWTELQFQEPPVPFPEFVRIYDDNGDGVGDRLVIVYSRGFDPDSLPNVIKVSWSKDTTISYGLGINNFTIVNGDTTYSMVNDKVANLQYWSRYLANPISTMRGAQLKEIKDSIVFVRGPSDEDSVRFSKDVLTRSESGKINNWVSFQQTPGGRQYDISLTSSIEDKIPAVVLKARYKADENNKGCGTYGFQCYDQVTLELSEPVKLDPDATSSGNDERKNSFAYKLRDLDKDAEWEIIERAYLPTAKYRNSKNETPGDNDSIVDFYFYRWRDEGNKSKTPMPGDSVKFASLGKYGFTKNMLLDHNGNQPNPKEIGKQIEGRKPFTPDKIPIGEINPNNPGYYLDKIRETLDENGSKDYPNDLFNINKPIELLPVPPDWTLKEVQRYYPGTIGILFNPDVFNDIAALEEEYGHIDDENITIYPRAFFHTNLGNFVADRDFAGGIKCSDKIFPQVNGKASCRDSRSKFYIAWDMKDFKGRYVGAGAYVGIYDFRWEVDINTAKFVGTKKMETIERQIEMHGVKRVKKVQ